MNTLADTALSIGINPDTLPACPVVGKWYFLAAVGKAKSNTSCRLRMLAHDVAYLHNFITGDAVTWFSDDIKKDPEQLKQAVNAAKYAQSMAERERERTYTQAAKNAKNIIDKFCTAPDPNHPYLLTKGLKPTRSIYQEGDNLVIPVYSFSDDGHRIQSLQHISPNGAKRFLKGGKMTGGIYTNPESMFAKNSPNYTPAYNGSRDIIIAEGWATSQSLAQQHGIKGWHICAFNAGNLFAVAHQIRLRYRNAPIIIAADNDKAGIKAAKDACWLTNATYYTPEFTDTERDKFGNVSDWNDRYLIDNGLMPLKPKKDNE
jgi:putative DNA primase/helicase